MAYDYESFKKDVYKLTNINLDLYKERQMKRRIEALITRHKFSGFEPFFQAMTKDEELLDIFVNYLTINVSEFYRNPSQWEMFEKDVLPFLMKKYGKKLTIWSAACSTGDEPYTIAMIMAKYMPLENIKIYATDIDDAVLRKAQLGIYADKSVAGLPKAFLEKYFTKTKDGKHYQISDDIKKCVDFRKHNLLEDKYFSDIHMVVCRNVVIYFTDEAKDMVYAGFHKSLCNEGILFIGSTEQIMNAKDLGFTTYKAFFYQKAGASVATGTTQRKITTSPVERKPLTRPVPPKNR